MFTACKSHFAASKISAMSTHPEKAAQCKQMFSSWKGKGRDRDWLCLLCLKSAAWGLPCPSCPPFLLFLRRGLPSPITRFLSIILRQASRQGSSQQQPPPGSPNRERLPGKAAHLTLEGQMSHLFASHRMIRINSERSHRQEGKKELLQSCLAQSSRKPQEVLSQGVEFTAGEFGSEQRD